MAPTPHQAGRAIGVAIGLLSDQLSGGVQEEWLVSAGISAARYRAELLLLSAAAALHAIESTSLSRAIESQLVSGFYAWVRSLEEESRALLLAELSEATDYYAEAASAEEATPAPLNEVSEIEAALGDRLLALGENNEVRGHACIRLCLVVPKTLWPVQYASARQMLGEAAVLTVQ
jgi:hypothetical protein